MNDRAPTSVLSDGTIRRLVEAGRIRIDPWDPDLVQPASVDLRLGDSFRVFHNHRASAIDLRDPPSNLTEEVKVSGDEPFVIHPGEFALGRTREWVELPDDIVARIEGKALALDTPVPTPEGFVRMGDLEVGDEVFDADGRPTRIVAVTPPMHDRPCRRLRFSDGETVIADVAHQWETRTKNDRRRGDPPRVVTTAEIERTLKYSAQEYNHHVDLAPPVEHEDRDLPIPPYVLGAWIGDGTSTKSEITSIDDPILRELQREGCGVAPATSPLAYRVGGEGHTRDPATGRYSRNGSLSSRLRNTNLLGNKHIPLVYMRASVAQRQALLEGLMDTDGYVDAIGRCELTTTSLRLADQYHELVASLGFKPRTARKTAWLNGKDRGPKWEVCFTPDRPVFRLPRKLQRQKRAGRFKLARSIVAVEPVESVPVRCIKVESPRGVFLITRSYIRTHNSSLGRLGLIVHATAGFCDPGWKGTLTLELANLTRIPIRLYHDLPIAQLSFMSLDAPAERPYGHQELGSHYQGQIDATASRYGQ
ncbi:MAG: replicative helicase [Solirubrobacteraceae bacterium]|jgi:deoxycytidine triphosphate deaminase|nr:replicative helicase [Solirubrobacteraceae bacterium]